MKHPYFVILLVVITVAVVLGGVWSVVGSRVPVQAAKAMRDEIREYVDERGMTRLYRTHDITMPFAARIQEIKVQEGQQVAYQDPVAQIDEGDLKDELDEATAVVERLEASILENQDASVESSVKEQAELFVLSMVSTVKAAEARMTSGKKRLDYAETFLARTSRLFQANAKTQDDVDLADVRHVEGQVDYQQDVLVWQAMKSIEAATRLLPRMVSEYILRKNLTGAVLEKQKSEAEARQRQARTRQARGRMVSPVDGVVLERPVQNEQFLPAGTLLMRIGNLQQLQIEADVLSQDVVRVRKDDPVEVYGPALGCQLGDGLPGRVDRIFPAGFTKVSSLGVEQQRVKVIIRLDKEIVQKLISQHEVRVGYRVRVRIFTENSPNALLVPRAALFRGADGGWQVFVVRSGRAVLQPIKVGLVNDDVAEVAQGVRDDEPVVLAPESSLRDGTRVRPILRHEESSSNTDPASWGVSGSP